MIELRIGGVPEHFNWPFHVVLGRPRNSGLAARLEWRDFPGGSAAMAAALTAGELDLAMLLTEGALAAIGAGADFRIVSVYIESPLVWGIHVPAASRATSTASIRGARYAVSRIGSGSHLMAAVHARAAGWDDELQLVPVGSIEGAVEAFEKGKADVFFWEKAMTQPLVAAGRFRRVGEFAAPWPAFVACVPPTVLADGPRSAAVAALLEEVLETAARLAVAADSPGAIAQRYGLDEAGVRHWLGATRWARRRHVGPELEAAADALQSVGLVPAGFSTTAACATLD